MKYKKIKISLFVVITIVVAIVFSLFFNLIKLPYFGHIIFVDYAGRLDDDRELLGASHYVFAGKVIEKSGYKKHSDIAPYTLYAVEVVDNIKGELGGKITVAEMGGYYFGVPYEIAGAAIINSGSTYLMATRYDEKNNWYILNTLPVASKLISEDDDLSSEELKQLALADEKYKDWQEAYKNEILPEADIKHNRVYNSYQLLYGQKQDGAIYYSGNSSYPLVLNGIAYPVNESPEISNKLNTDDLKELSLIPVMTVPENSWIFNIGRATGTDDIYFVINSMLNYWYTAHQNSPVLKNPAGGGVTVLSVFKYEPVTATITKIFDTTEIEELVRKYPVIQSVSADSRYLAFNVYGCWGCGAGHPTTFLYDTEKKTGLSIGRVFGLEWLENGNYRYKKYIEIPCEHDEGWGCYKNPDGLPILSGKLN